MDEGQADTVWVRVMYEVAEDDGKKSNSLEKEVQGLVHVSIFLGDEEKPTNWYLRYEERLQWYNWARWVP